MSDYLRFLVTIDPASGEPVKVEQVGEAGDLTQVDLPAFVRSLGAGSANPQPQIVVNIFGGGAAGTAGAVATQASGPPTDMAITAPPPVTPPPPHRPQGRKRAKK